MSEILTREHLEENLIHNKAFEMEGKETTRANVKYLIALHKTALYWQDKCERQAAALEQAREAFEECIEIAGVQAYIANRPSKIVGICTSALAAIEGVKE
jgi:hypothetical protein